jgi:peptidoglycan hydrolase CwlO-like protein
MTSTSTWRRRGCVIAGTLAAIMVALTAVAGPAVADSFDPQRRDAEARAAQAAQAARTIAASIDGLNSQLAQAVQDLQGTQTRLPLAQAELASAQQDLERSQREALLVAVRLQDAQTREASITTTLAADDARGAQVRTAVGQVARRAYKGETAATGLAVVMGAQSAQDLVDQYNLVASALRTQTKALGDFQQSQAADRSGQLRLTAVKEKVVALKAEADQNVVAAAAAKTAAAARQTEIENLIAAQASKQNAIAGMKAQAEVEQAKIDAQRAVIAAELAGILAKQRAAQAAAQAAARATRSRRPAPGAASCTLGTAGAPGGSLPTRIGPYQGDQIINAAQIIIAGNDLGVDVRGQAVAVMTAIGESTLTNINYGDTAGPDSRGLFQQRANGAWGSYADRMDPRTAASSFFRALLRVGGWESMSPTLAAHAVQGNADANYYAPYWNNAVLIVGTLGGDPSLSCR